MSEEWNNLQFRDLSLLFDLCTSTSVFVCICFLLMKTPLTDPRSLMVKVSLIGRYLHVRWVWVGGKERERENGVHVIMQHVHVSFIVHQCTMYGV